VRSLQQAIPGGIEPGEVLRGMRSSGTAEARERAFTREPSKRGLVRTHLGFFHVLKSLEIIGFLNEQKCGFRQGKVFVP